MQFFRSLFSNQPEVEEETPQQNQQPFQFEIFFSTSKSDGTIVTITPEMTCDDILKIYSDNMHPNKTNLTFNEDDYEFVLCNSNNMNTSIVLKQSTCPFQYLQHKNWSIYYLLKANRNTKFQPKQALTESSQSKSNSEIIKEGEVMIYKPKKRWFRKKRATLTKSTFSYLKSNKKSSPFSIPVSSIANIKKSLEESPDDIKKQITEENIFELILTNRTIFIFRVRKEAEYAHWIECFENVLMKQYEEQLDLNYNNLIEHYIANIGRTANIELEKLDDLRLFIKVEAIRKLFYTLYKNKQYSDIFESILSYKESVVSFEFFQSWACFKQLVSILHIEGFKKEFENQKKELELFSMEKIDRIILLSQQIKELFEKLRTTPSNCDINETLQPLFPDDLFDEIYHNIIEKFFIPFYEQPEIKAQFIQRVTSVLALEFEKENKFFLHKYCLLGIDTNEYEDNI